MKILKIYIINIYVKKNKYINNNNKKWIINNIVKTVPKLWNKIMT